jgi:hypothetical protein
LPTIKSGGDRVGLAQRPLIFARSHFPTDLCIGNIDNLQIPYDQGWGGWYGHRAAGKRPSLTATLTFAAYWQLPPYFGAGVDDDKSD